MEISKVIIGQGTTMNRHQRRAQAKRLSGSVCNRHHQKLSLHGTQLICDKCIAEYRKAKKK